MEYNLLQPIKKCIKNPNRITNIGKPNEWMHGERQSVKIIDNNNIENVFVFYLQDGKVITVWKNDLIKGRIKVSGKPYQFPLFSEIKRNSNDFLPEYTILDIVSLIDYRTTGEKCADILIANGSNISIEDREPIFRLISSIEGFSRSYFYSTREAKTANYSTKYQEENSDALNGYLGCIDGEEFIEP